MGGRRVRPPQPRARRAAPPRVRAPHPATRHARKQPRRALLPAVSAAAALLVVVAGSSQMLRSRFQPRHPIPMAGGLIAKLGPTTVLPSSPTPTTVASPSRTLAATVSSTLSRVHCTGPGTAAALSEAAALQNAIAAGRAGTATRTGVAVADQVSGVSCGANDRSRFRSASIIKVTTVATMLWQADREGREPTTTERSWAKRAITVSDNDAQSALWQHVGSSTGVSEFLEAAAMTRTIPGTGGAWGLTQVTAEDQARLLGVLTRPGLLSEQSRSYELGLMRQVESDQAWGVSAAAEDTGESVALKNGWLVYPSLWVVNSIGYITGSGHRFTLVVLSEGSSTMAAGISAAESIADSIGDVIN